MLRHGETQVSLDGVFCGDTDAPLSENGHAQAERIAPQLVKLKLEAIYVSPMQRARDTAAPVARLLGLTPVIERDLREIGYGSWEGKKEADLAKSDPQNYSRWVQDPAHHAPPGGENGYAIAARSMPVVERVLEAHSGNVLLVSHKATIRVVACALMGLHVGRFRDRVGCPTCSLTTFEFGSRGPMLTRIAERMEF